MSREAAGSAERRIRRGILRRDVRSFPAFTEGPHEFYERGVIEHHAPPRSEPEPAAATVSRPRNFVRCLPAFAIRVVPVGR